MQDRFVKVLLVIIAGLLVVNLFRSNDQSSQVQLPAIIGSAIAQSSSNDTTNYSSYRVRSVGGQEVADIKDIIAVGDGKSFVVSNTKGFMVYQVQGVTR